VSPPYARTFADVTPSRPFWYKKSKKKKGVIRIHSRSRGSVRCLSYTRRDEKKNVSRTCLATCLGVPNS
jgi:hypothetical protein